MTPKTKIKLLLPILGIRQMKAKKLAKKIKKWANEPDRYPEDFKNTYIIKKAKKFAKLLNVELEVQGFDKLPKHPVVLAPNHASSFDPALIMMALENPLAGEAYDDHKAVFIAKDDLKKNKKFAAYANILNTFYIDRKNPRQAIEVLNEMVDHAKKEKKHLVIFPEGTRSQDGNINEFKGGAFKIAKQAFLPVIPVTINNALSITDLNRKGKLKVQVIFHDEIKPMSFMTSENKYIAQRVQKVVESSWVKPEGKRSEEESKLA